MQNKQFTIKEFSHLTGIKRENLRYYDRIGLLCPEVRGTNNYRYYSRQQLNSAYLISSLRGLNVSIEEIKRYAADHTPDDTLALFSQQSKKIQAEIRQLKEMNLIMQIYSDMIIESQRHQNGDMFIEEKQQETIFLCPSIPSHMSEDEGAVFSYDYAEDHGINLGFPCGTRISEKTIIDGDVEKEGQYFFKTQFDGNDQKPAGKYAVIYDTCIGWKTKHIYEKLLTYIKDQNLYICGDAYEEYPIGNSIIQEKNLNCIRIEIPVKCDLKNHDKISL